MATLDIYNLQGEFRTGKLLEEGIFVTPVCRLSHEHLYVKSAAINPATGQPGKPTFNANFIFNCQNVDQPGLVDPFSVFWPYVESVATSHFQAAKKPLPFGFPLNIQDGRVKEGKEGYGMGYWFIAAKNHSETISNVPIVDGQLNPLGPGQYKSGDFVRARVQPYVPKTANGIFYGLKSVQLVMPWEGFSAAKEDTGQEWSPVPTAGQVPAPAAGRDW